MGPGKVFLKDTKISEWTVQIEVHLYNFEINVSALKDEHRKFLSAKVIPALSVKVGATARLHGSASRSGENNDNKTLSGSRAAEVERFLAAAGVGSRVKEVKPLGEPTGPGPQEDERDRAVFIFLSFVIRVESIDLLTDDWSRKLDWRDIIELDGITKVNIQVELSGAPRLWDWDVGWNRPLMPREYQVIARRGPEQTLTLPQAGPLAQPKDPFRTLYRLSGSSWQIGLGGSGSGGNSVVSVSLGSVRVSLELWEHGGGWTSRGGYSGTDTAQALRLVKAGGRDTILVTDRLSYIDPRKTPNEWWIRDPAHVFFYSGDGSPAGCLSQAGKCWVTAKDIEGYWKGVAGPVALIVAAPVLGIATVGDVALTGPGKEWAKLLASTRLMAILGYKDKAPAIKGIGEDIAKKMSQKIFAGLKNADEWVRAWLNVNGDHPGKDTWNAVGINARGYWSITGKSPLNKGMDWVQGSGGSSHKISGPVKIV